MQMIQQFRNIMSQPNADSMFKMMAMNNPNCQTLLSWMNGSGITPKDAFYMIARQRGIDPDQFLANLKSK